MSAIGLLSTIDLPQGFSYPPAFLRVVEHGIIDLQPWYVLSGDELIGTYFGLAERYPGTWRVPFARRQDNDDVACFRPFGEGVVLVHDHASPGWEQRGGYDNFHDWLRNAVEDFIAWES